MTQVLCYLHHYTKVISEWQGALTVGCECLAWTIIMGPPREYA